MRVKTEIKKLNENAIIPTLGSEFAAGADLYAQLEEGIESVTIEPGKTEKIGTGIALAIQDGNFGGIFARSGLATKEGLRPANCVGVIDSDYRGEIIVTIHNDSSETRTIQNHERIAQLIIIPYLYLDFEEVDTLSETTRGANGFGSTGVN